MVVVLGMEDLDAAAAALSATWRRERHETARRMLWARQEQAVVGALTLPNKERGPRSKAVGYRAEDAQARGRREGGRGKDVLKMA